MTGITEDQPDALRRLAFLEVSGPVLLAASTDFASVLEQVADLVVPALADWCAIDIVEDDGSVRRVAFTGVELADPETAAQLQGLLPDSGPTQPMLDALRSGRSLLIPDVQGSLETWQGVEPAHIGLVRRLGFRSTIIVPLVARGRTIGIATLSTSTSGRTYGEADLRLAEDLALRAALAVDNARLFEAIGHAEARKSAILESALDAIVSMDHQGLITDFNPAAERIFGHARGDVIGRRLSETIIPAWLRERHESARERYLESGEPHLIGRRVEMVGLRRDGTEFPIELAVTQVEVTGPPTFTAYIRDITEQKRAEHELFESRERFAQMARTLQESLLPPHLPEVPGVQVAARYRAAGAGNEVGGDFYDVWHTGGDGWAIVMGDVQGKGADAAAVTALARYTLRAAAMQSRRPSRVLAQLNEAILRQRGGDRFCTAVYTRLRPSDRGVRVTVAIGGHPLPLVLRAGGGVEPIGKPGTLLGLLEHVDLREEATELLPGDALVLFTDGVTEARSSEGRIFGEYRLRELVATCAGLDAFVIAERVSQAVLDLQGGELRDDVAVLVLRVPA